MAAPAATAQGSEEGTPKQEVVVAVPKTPPSSRGDKPLVRLALPKGRLQEEVLKLMHEAGVHVLLPDRGFRAKINIPGWEVKLLNPRDCVILMKSGSRDVGFAGDDLVKELEAGPQLKHLLTTGLCPVRIVAAAPAELLDSHKKVLVPPAAPRVLRIATEYRKLTEDWVKELQTKSATPLDVKVIVTRGATEAFPPDDADMIVDNTSSGATLAANNLYICAELMNSSTHVFVNKHVDDMKPSVEDAEPLTSGQLEERKRSIAHFVEMLSAVLEGRKRVLLECNVGTERFQEVVALLSHPICMKQPTVSQLYGSTGYAVKVAVERSKLFEIIPKIKQHGGTDIFITNLIGALYLKKKKN
jgi:ATP phosphoribosyltransferase